MTPPNINDIYSLMGFTLEYIQVVEKTIKTITTYVFQEDGDLTLEKLKLIERNEQKKALGYFFGKLKERVELDPSVENLLSDFLSRRNDFIHNQYKVPGWDLHSSEGQVVAKKFTITLLRQAQVINEIFISLIFKWQEQIGINLDVSDDSESIEKIYVTYKPQIDLWFTKNT